MLKRLTVAILLSSGVLLVSQVKRGRLEDMRIPIFDYLPFQYHYFQPNVNQWQIDPDPTGKTEGIWTIKFPAPAQPAIEIGAPIPNGVVGTPYSQSLMVSGGTAPYAWSIESGTLPPGLSLSAGGVISGTPTTLGTYIVTVKVADSTGAAARSTWTSVPMTDGVARYVGGPTGRIIVNNRVTPPEIDVATP